MSKKILDRLPAAVRQPITMIPRSHEVEATAAFNEKIRTALLALGDHYRADPSNGTFWMEMFLGLAGDFLPAWRWARNSSAPKVGRRRIGSSDDVALAILYSERKRLARLSTKDACDKIAAQWVRSPKKNPFGRQLKATTLRKYLARAKPPSLAMALAYNPLLAPPPQNPLLASPPRSG